MESITNTIVKAIPETITAGAQSVLGIVALSIVILSIIAILFFKNSSERTKIFIFVTLFIGIGMFIYAVVLQKQSEGHGNLDDEPITLNGSLNRNENNTHKINLVAGNIIEIKPKLVSVDSLYFDMVLYSSEDSAKRCGIARWKGSSLGNGMLYKIEQTGEHTLQISSRDNTSGRYELSYISNSENQGVNNCRQINPNGIQ